MPIPSEPCFSGVSVKKIQDKRLQEYLDRLEEDILSMGARGSDQSLDEDQSKILAQRLATKKQLLKKLKNSRATGRMVIDLPAIIDDPASSSDFELRAGDRLVVEKRPDSVNIMGEVYNPTAVLAVKNETVDFYLERVGGITPTAEGKNIHLVKANGTVMSKTQEGFFGMTSWDSQNERWVMNFGSVRLDPGDTIIVPKKMDEYGWLKLTKDLTQIMYQIAVGAGVVVAAYD